MSDWKRSRWNKRPEPSPKREKAMSKEVSPCSEYTRYTAEGRLKDPHSDLSAIIGSELVGFLFRLAPFANPKWSAKLGYGMAVVGEDTRVHLHANGKYVIRRGLDRRHAEDVYRCIAEIAKPALYSTETGSFVFEIVRDRALFHGGDEEEPVKELMSWPGGEDPLTILSSAVDSFKKADGMFSHRFEDLSEAGSLKEPDDILEGMKEAVDMYSSSLERIMDPEEEQIPGEVLGLGSYLLLLRTALRGE